MSTKKATEKPFNPEVACWRKLAFTLKQTKMRWGQIADALNERGHKSEKGKPLTDLIVKAFYKDDCEKVLNATLPPECQERYERDLASITGQSIPVRDEHTEQAEPNEQTVPDVVCPERGEGAEQIGQGLPVEETPRLSNDEDSEIHSEPSEQDGATSVDELPEHSEPSEQLTLEQITEHLMPLIHQIATEVYHSMTPYVPNIPDTTTDDVPPEPETLKGTDRGGRREIRDYEKLSATVDVELAKLFKAERDLLKCSTGRLMDIILWRHYGRPLLSYELPDAEERARARPTRKEVQKEKALPNQETDKQLSKEE